jgi:AmiR/NasT family two-component response regulator
VGTDVKHMADGLRILLADEDRAALERTADVLTGLGHGVTASAIDLAEVTEAVAREDPDLAVVVVHEDDEHALALIEEINAFARGPVIALVIGDDPSFARRAADRGIYACAQDLDPEALQSAIEVAVRRHAENERLSEQVDRLESALERRALIERAKGIIMERHGLPEREAFEVLRSHARSRSRPVVEIAGAVVEGHGLLPTGAAAR